MFKCLKNADLHRMSNGCIEVLFGYHKKFIIKPCLPAIYINKTLGLSIGQKRISELMKIESCTSESDSNCPSEIEELPHEAREIWKPNSQQKSAINKEKKGEKKFIQKNSWSLSKTSTNS